MNFLLACPVCFGAPGHQTTEALGWAVLFMLGILIPVLGGFLSFMIYLIRRARRSGGGEP
ncbi:MAG TPA: hypothetical protein VMN36_04510 [Verrucomicrobiales bacterium]|nr:hypothetical protein [Verrucomicrobiales bacterium]